MYLRFVSISITRFRSFNETAVLHFDDVGSGLYFLKGKNKTNSALGSNGSGKSSTIDALLWCLYGKTVQGLKNPDITPWSGKGKTEVEVCIEIDKQKHVIKRTVGPNLLTIDGKEAGQEYVNKLIAIPFEIIPYTIILGQRQPLFFDLTASEKLKLFSEVLNLDRWEARSAHAAELVKSLENEISIKQSEIASLETSFKQASSDLNALKLQSAAWEAERASKLDTAAQSKIELQAKIDAVMNERDTADLKLDGALTELKAIKPSLDRLNAEERALSNSIAKLTSDHRQAATEDERLLDMLEAISDEKCPTCNQSLKSQKQRKDLEDNLTKQIEALELVDKREKLDVAIAQHKKILTALKAQDEAKEKFETDAEEARDILDRLLPKIANWEAEIKSINKEIAQDSDAGNPFTEQVQVLRRRKDQSKVTIEQGQKTITSKSEYCERVRFWIKGFKDVKLLLVEEVLQEMEITTNSMCEESGLVGWQLKYDVERENKSGNITKGINITVLSPANKNAVKWEVWSGGEAQRLRLIGTAALSSVLLNHVGVTTNIEIYDEPTVGLSKEGVQDLVELLAERAKSTKKSIFLIDHHAIESSKFIQTLLVTKDKSGSHLEIV